MNTATRFWLCGQIDAIRKLAESVAATVRTHDVDAAKHVDKIAYACNCAEAVLDWDEIGNIFDKDESLGDQVTDVTEDNNGHSA